MNRRPHESRTPIDTDIAYQMSWLRFCAAVAVGDSDSIATIVTIDGKEVQS